MTNTLLIFLLLSLSSCFYLRYDTPNDTNQLPLTGTFDEYIFNTETNKWFKNNRAIKIWRDEYNEERYDINNEPSKTFASYKVGTNRYFVNINELANINGNDLESVSLPLYREGNTYYLVKFNNELINTAANENNVSVFSKYNMTAVESANTDSQAITGFLKRLGYPTWKNMTRTRKWVRRETKNLKLIIKNDCDVDIWVSLGFKLDDDSDIRLKGWWKIETGKSSTFHRKNVDPKKWFYVAENQTEKKYWYGNSDNNDPHWGVTNQAYDYVVNKYFNHDRKIYFRQVTQDPTTLNIENGYYVRNYRLYCSN